MTTRRSVAAAAGVLAAFALSWPLGAQVARRSAVPSASTAPGTTTRALNPAPNPEALGFDTQRLAKLDTYMAKAVADGRVAGMITLLARHGQVVAEKSYGYKSLA